MHFDFANMLASQPGIGWKIPAFSILIGAALLVHGVSAVSKRWEKDLKLPHWFDVAGEIIGMIVATVLGGVVGMIIWNVILGTVVAFVGSWSSSFIISIIRSQFQLKKSDDSSDKP